MGNKRGRFFEIIKQFKRRIRDIEDSLSAINITNTEALLFTDDHG